MKNNLIITEASVSDYPTLQAIWARSVKATHDFLAKEDFDYYKEKLISDYFCQVSLYAGKKEEKIVGFIGLAEDFIEMLFIDPDYQHQGIGKELVCFACQHHQVRRVDVNEQNKQALAFYQKQGFNVTARSETDGQDRPYPILHLKK